MFEMPMPAVEETISPRDAMYAPGKEAHYFSCGRSALRNIHAGLFIANAPSPAKILDLACGHGRVLRMLRAYFPDAEITACDLDRDAVDFCGQTFAANKAYSDADFENIQLSGAFDLIWSGSLLTHIDQASWQKFFDFCEAQLAPGGLLVFTTHGRYIDRMMTDYNLLYGLEPGAAQQLQSAFRTAGFGYRNYPGEGGYGVSLAKPSWVTSFLEEHSNMQICLANEMGWDHHQDVFVCAPKQPHGWQDLAAYRDTIIARETVKLSPSDTQQLRISAAEPETQRKIINWVEQNITKDTMPFGPRVHQILVRDITLKLTQ